MCKLCALYPCGDRQPNQPSSQFFLLNDSQLLEAIAPEKLTVSRSSRGERLPEETS